MVISCSDLIKSIHNANNQVLGHPIAVRSNFPLSPSPVSNVMARAFSVQRNFERSASKERLWTLERNQALKAVCEESAKNRLNSFITQDSTGKYAFHQKGICQALNARRVTPAPLKPKQLSSHLQKISRAWEAYQQDSTRSLGMTTMTPELLKGIFDTAVQI